MLPNRFVLRAVVLAMPIAALGAAGCGERPTVTTTSKSSQEATERRLKAIDEDKSISAEEKERRRKLVERRTNADRSIAKDADQR